MTTPKRHSREQDNLRVRFKKKDLEKYLGTELPMTIIKHWLDLGRLIDIHTKFGANGQNNLPQKIDDIA